MRTDLGNIVFTLSEGAEGHALELVARHRAFPEVQARGQSPCQVLVALIFLLKQAWDWAPDPWHSTELAQAIFDAESLLILGTSTENTKIKFRDYYITKNYDIIYYIRGEPPAESALGTADHDDDRPGLVEGGDNWVQIYSIGRRVADRPRSMGGEGPEPGQPEQRRSEQRERERRQFNRISLIACIP